ncbi:MAG: serine/threonine-protein kinase, partial [Planctomycetota bacterium]
MSTSGPPPTESTPDPPRSSAFSGTPEVVTEPKTVVRPAGTPESGSHVLDSLADFKDVAGVGGGSGSLSNRLFPPDGVETGPLDGISLGHFTIERRIGRGGMGAVFRAIDARLQRPVALKVLSPSLSRDESAVARFLNEARSAAQLDDDHVARVFHYGDDDGLHYIAFEYIEGLDIRQRIRRDGRLRIGEALGIATQLAMALRATSAVDVVHRDIKPSNVIVTSSGRVKLVDLGLARKPPSESVGELTVPGTTLGTFDYISPEQAKDPRDVDVRSDLYSLGCTLYHMLTGEPPYPEGTLLQKLLDHQDKAVPDPRRITPAVPAAVAALCMRLMSPDPAERPQTAEEALTELAAAARRSGVRRAGVSYTGMPQPPTRREGQAKTWAIGAGLAAAVVAALFAADTFSRTQRTPDSFDELNATTRVEEPTAGDGLSVRDDVPAPPPNADPVEARDVVETDASAPAIAAGGSVDGDVPTESAADTDIEASSLADVSDEILPTEIDEIEEQFPAFASTEDPAGDRKPAVSDVPTIFPQAPSVAAIGPPPFLLVDPGGDGTPFRTLEAACTAAADGDVIELDFDGRSRPETLGVRLGRKTLTLRPAVTDEGVARRPVIVFAPDADATSPAAFFIAGGGVNLFGLAIDVVGDGPTGGTPAVADISGVGRLRLDGVVVTLGEDVTLMRFEDAIGSDPFAVAGSPATAETAFEVELDDSIIRGEGSLFAGRLGVAGRVEVDG